MHMTGILISILLFPLFQTTQYANYLSLTDVQTASSISDEAEALNRAIDGVLKQSEFAWRLPKEIISKEKESTSLFKSFFNWVSEYTKKILNTIEDIFDWYNDIFPQKNIYHPPISDTWKESVRKYLTFLLVGISCIFLLMMFRIWKKRGKKSEIIDGKSIIDATPDLSEESVYPGDLPANKWFTVAKSQLDQLSLKHALRAFYIGIIALLGEHRILTIKRYKSNRDYEKELKRRMHQFPEIIDIFLSMTEFFEKIWYGNYEINFDDIKKIELLSERMTVLVMNSNR